MFSLNLNIRDTPNFYTPGIGPKVSWDLAYNSVNPNDPADVGPFSYLFGPNISCVYAAHIVDLGSVVHVVMPDGRTDWYYQNSGSSSYSPAIASSNYGTLTKNADGSFTLAEPRGGNITFGLAFLSGTTNYVALTKVADRFGNELTFAYSADTVPKLMTLTDANGNVSSLTYNAAGQVSQISDPFGGNAQFGYTSVGAVSLLSSLTDQAGYTSTLSYDGQGRVIAMTTPLTAPNATSQFAYIGSTGQVASVTDAAGNQRRFAATSSSTAMTDELGRTTRHDFSNNLFGASGTITDAMGNQTQQVYDANQNLIQVINANGYATQFTYDGNGNCLTRTDYLNPYPDTSASVQRSWTWDSNKNLTSFTDPAGTESFTYLNNLVATATDKLGQQTSYSYDNLGRLVSMTDRNGNVSLTNSYSSAGPLVSVRDGLGNTLSFGWDSRGRRTRVTDPAGYTTSLAYDMLDRIIQVDYPDNTTSQATYNCCRLTQTIDQAGGVIQIGYDSLGRKNKSTDQAGGVTTWAHDAVGNLTAQTDPNQQTWRWQYNALNQRTIQIDPLQNQETLSYDPLGNKIKLVDGNGATTRFTSDGLNRLTQMTFADGTTEVYTYDSVGNRLAVDNVNGHWSWTYDALRQVTSATTPEASGATTYYYDKEGNCTQITDVDGNSITKQYDAASQLTAVSFPFAGQTLSAQYQYDPRGFISQRMLPNGIVSSYSRDSLGRTSAIQHKQSSGSVLFDFNYQYDPVGNLTQESSQRWDVTQDATVSFGASYSYDSRYQLITEKYTLAGTLARERDSTYDPAGNRTKLVTTIPSAANSPITLTSTFAADNQITQSVLTSPQSLDQTTTYTEDGNGCLTQAVASTGTTTYSYDLKRRLTQVAAPGGSVISFRLDPTGLRTRETNAAGQQTRAVLDNLRVMVEKDGNGITQARYVPQVARITPSSIGYYLEDRQGSVIGMADATQAVTDTMQYDALGNVIARHGTTGTPYLWFGGSGYRAAPEVGLYLLGVRHVSPAIGRFLTRDPLGHWTGDYNLYNYVMNRPFYYRDPTGRVPQVVIAGASGCAVGATWSGGSSFLINWWACGDPWRAAAIGGCDALGGCITGAAVGIAVALNASYAPAAGCLGGAVGGIAAALCKLKAGVGGSGECEAINIGISAAAGCLSGLGAQAEDAALDVLIATTGITASALTSICGQ